MSEAIRPVDWRDGACLLLDQRRLPGEERYLRLESAEAVAAAIQDMVVRGAPAIGIAAAYGAAIAVTRHAAAGGDWRAAVEKELQTLEAARPTAANLSWALGRMRVTIAKAADEPAAAAVAEARRIHEEDVRMNHRMGEIGAGLLGDPCEVVTHCNAGALATGGYGTALGVIRSGWRAGLIRAVYAGETRPWLQGSRLTAWELARDGIPVDLYADSAMAQMFRERRPAWLIVGADRIVANGDVANKIGTYSLALLARDHGARVMVVAPSSTVDMATGSGAEVPIEDRSTDEVWDATGAAEPLAGVRIHNPAFDVTPAALIDVIVTERGRVERPDEGGMARMMKACHEAGATP